MRLLWAYEHDFVAISPFLSERIGTLCCHPCSVLWFEQRTTGWCSGRSEGDTLRRARPHGTLTPHAANIPSGSQVISLVRPTGRPAFHSVCHPWIGCRSQHRGMGSRPLRMKVPSGVVATVTPDPELTTMLARAAVSIGLEVNRPPSPEPSQLDDWFLGAGRSSQPHSVPVPIFPEGDEELTKSWMAPFTARSRSSISSFLTTLDGGAARGNAGIPQVERAVAVHLCP